MPPPLHARASHITVRKGRGPGSPGQPETRRKKGENRDGREDSRAREPAGDTGDGEGSAGDYCLGSQRQGRDLEGGEPGAEGRPREEEAGTTPGARRKGAGGKVQGRSRARAGDRETGAEGAWVHL
jgi:hypothetical protein